MMVSDRSLSFVKTGFDGSFSLFACWRSYDACWFFCLCNTFTRHQWSRKNLIKLRVQITHGREEAKNSYHLFLELAVSDEDKHCYACKGATDDCVTACHWTQRCFTKAKHANATSSSLSVSVQIVSFSSVRLVIDRQCTTERWTRELLVDGCLSYMKSYWCMCSSDMCNGGDLDSIRGKPKPLLSGGEFKRFFESRIRGLFKESVSRWNDLSGYQGRIYLYLCPVARGLHTM